MHLADANLQPIFARKIGLQCRDDIDTLRSSPENRDKKARNRMRHTMEPHDRFGFQPVEISKAIPSPCC